MASGPVEPGNESVPVPDVGDVSPPNPFKEPVGGGKKDRHPCPDKGEEHDWECNTTGCAGCWEPPCEENRKKEQDAYDQKQSGSPGDKVDAHKAENDAKRAKQQAAGRDDPGAEFENQFLDKIGPDDVEHVGYMAHCKKCHSPGELDVVTKDSVVECKRSAKLLKADQMKENIIPIAQKCFPGKKLQAATRSSELSKLENKLKQKSWKDEVATPIEPIDP